MVKFFRRIVDWFMDLNLSIKIIINYSVIFLTFFMIITFSYQQINNGFTINKVQQMSSEIVKSIGSNFEFIINTANSQSKILISNPIIQDTLKSGKENFENQTQVYNYLAGFINFDDMISSIYLFDMNGNEYYIENASPKAIRLSDMQSQKWFDQLVNLQGGYMILTNGGSTFTGSDGNYISLIRVINSLDTQKPIGYMIINISAHYIDDALYSGSNLYNTRFILRDDSNAIFTRPDNPDFDGITSGELNKSRIIQIRGKDYIISNTRDSFGWSITSITPFNELKRQTKTYNLVIILAILVSGGLFFAGMALVSMMITKPILKLVGAMTAVEKGEFKEARFRTGNDEIGKLKDVYNMMIREIQRLFDNMVQENKAKRKKELEVLQSQIKPHFLYNSFDAISSLALSGNNREVYEIVKALGKFYKGFLNNGYEEISVRNELEIVEQYLTIQKIRFADKFTIHMSCDPGALDCRIPKLILQPLVENAFNHGIKPLPGNGVITLEARDREDSIQLKVSDNGVGMDEETVRRIRERQTQGVGLRGTIERLRIYYGNPDVFNIESQKGHGTTIIITIPKSQEPDKHE